MLSTSLPRKAIHPLLLRVGFIRLVPQPLYQKAGWSKKFTQDGEAYYQNHQTRVISLDRPTTQEQTVSQATPPPGGLGTKTRNSIVMSGLLDPLEIVLM